MGSIKLNFFHVSDNAFFSKEKKLSVIQIFENIEAKSFPAMHPELAISFNFNGEKRNHKVKIEIISPERNDVIAKVEQEIEITHENGMANIVAKIIGLIFPVEGQYKFIITIDDDFVDDSNYITLLKT